VAKTGAPSAPSPSQARTVAPPSLAPAVAPIISTARVCSVIGTGQKGTCTFEASVSSAMPSPTASTLLRGRDSGNAWERRLPFMIPILRVMP